MKLGVVGLPNVGKSTKTILSAPLNPIRVWFLFLITG